MKKIIPVIKRIAVFYCVIFTVATLVNSIGALWFGMETNPDVHGHIILRAGICLGISVLVAVIQKISLKGKISVYIITCAVALCIIIAFIWALTSGYLWVNVNDVHPDAFRDLTRSIAVPFAVISIIVILVKAWQSRK